MSSPTKDTSFIDTDAMLPIDQLYSQIGKNKILDAIQRDVLLKGQDKTNLENKVKNTSFLQDLIHEGGGAAIGYAIAKFLHMGKSAQLMLSIAGFGIGKLLLDAKNNKSTQFDRTSKMYVNKE